MKRPKVCAFCDLRQVYELFRWVNDGNVRIPLTSMTRGESGLGLDPGKDGRVGNAQLPSGKGSRMLGAAATTAGVRRSPVDLAVAKCAHFVNLLPIYGLPLSCRHMACCTSLPFEL